jgi:hypothetical protein
MSRVPNDIETVLDDIETFLKANLNTQIAALNTEKADSITLDTVASDAYILQSLNNTVTNFNPWVFYGIETTKSDGKGPSTAVTYVINVIIALTDNGNDTNIGRRMLRYSRVLKDLFETNWRIISDRLTFTVESLEPISFKLQNNTASYMAVGVQLETTLA